MKQILILASFAFTFNAVKAQHIPSWKITDVVQYYSKTTDSVYVVNFWGTFCKPCVAELPFIQSIIEKYVAEKVQLLLVSLDLKAYYPAKIKQFAKERQVKAPIVWLNETDADYFCNAIDTKWSGSIPATIFVNSRTGYRRFYEEEFTPETFEAALIEALRQ
ncbi:MAG TPA: TlpA disulfide reductase family protein [Ferruginibacter sp.]|nr:TlpA disulfide reductase family protein [Ferruginibacter sp.]HMP20432.1 TlpA disulfide reductase family protein [Ferruginibacter sp.]